MNLEIEIPGLRIKLEYADKKQIDRTVNAVMNYVQGGKFTDVYDVAQNYVKMTDLKPSKSRVTPEVDGVKNYPDGKTKYKCFYSCGCNHTGIRWVEKTETVTYCHDCNGELLISPVLDEKGEPSHDKDFNYYMAY